MVPGELGGPVSLWLMRVHAAFLMRQPANRNPHLQDSFGTMHARAAPVLENAEILVGCKVALRATLIEQTLNHQQSEGVGLGVEEVGAPVRSSCLLRSVPCFILVIASQLIAVSIKRSCLRPVLCPSSYT